MKSRSFKLWNDLNIPAVGLGTCRIRKAEDVNIAVDAAIRNGYRLIDTAPMYRNEAFISRALGGIYADKTNNVKVIMAVDDNCD